MIVLAEVKLGEVGVAPMLIESHGTLQPLASTNASRLGAARLGESIGRMNSQTTVRSGFSPPGSAFESLRAIRPRPRA